MRHLELRTGAYVDSVSLMQVSRRLSALDGVRSAMVAMATDLNVVLAAGMGFDVPDASPTEMLVAVDATDEAALAEALADLAAALLASSRPDEGGFGSAPAPLTVRAAAARVDAATVALVSTPGEWAFADAVDAVDAGLHAMVFSDNVPVEQEVALKDRAAAAGVLVMGPDCGTALIGGVGLGFANVVRPGPVGLVAASGTGAQHLMSLLDANDVGISHCLGVGGRDLSTLVGGRSTLQALDLLDLDDATSLIVVVSKPPAPEVAAAVRAHADRLRTPVLLALLGPGQPDLTETAAAVVAAAGGTWTAPEHWPGSVERGRPGGALRGLFAGGTLCEEAMLVATERLGPVYSNIPLDPRWAVGVDLSLHDHHALLDLGDDRLTRGRPHPMIDPSTRVGLLRAQIADPHTSVLLLDVVLGLGAEPDPAGELEPVVRVATAERVPVVVGLVGTRDDPQGLRSQAARLVDAGAWVHLSNAAAARCALDLLAGGAR
ncbi:MAG TPA: FdrA family protein [Nocardioidaceae bacterium]|nr:FdrA family protein [Nocardioidaceae bacterium]